MTNGSQATARSTCGDCGMIYTATPEQRPEGHSGEFDCVDCGKTVLERTGFYSFAEWEPEPVTCTSPAASMAGTRPAARY